MVILDASRKATEYVEACEKEVAHRKQKINKLKTYLANMQYWILHDQRHYDGFYPCIGGCRTTDCYWSDSYDPAVLKESIEQNIIKLKEYKKKMVIYKDKLTAAIRELKAAEFAATGIAAAAITKQAQQ